MVVQTVKVGPLLRCDSRFAILALGGQQSRQFLRNNKWLFVRRVGRCKKAYELAQDQDSHGEPPELILAPPFRKANTATLIAARTAAMKPAAR